jgi:hypothetical protein
MVKEVKKKLEKSDRVRGVRAIILNLIRFLLVVAFIGAMFNERNLIMIISALAFFVTFLPIIFKKFFDIELPAQFEVIVVLFIYGTLLFGEIHGFYSEYWWWSALINFAAASALGFVGLAVMYALYRGDKIHASPFVIALFSFCFAVAVGTVWELFELFLDFSFGFNLYNSGDTMNDLVVNLFGAFVVSSVGYYYIKNGKVVIISGLISKFVERNPKLFGKDLIVDHSDMIKSLIDEGEGKKIEFKATLRTNLHTNQADKRMEHGVLKTVTAYLNSEGGTLLVGVGDDGNILGIKKDGFPSDDKANLHVNSLIKDHIGGEFLPFIKSQIVNIDGKGILKVDVDKCHKEVFLKRGNEERFYIRSGSSSVELLGRSLVEYIQHNFKGLNESKI